MWIVGLSIMCLGVFGYGIANSTNGIPDPAYIAGQSLVYALLLWAVFSVIFLRSQGSGARAVAFAALFLAFFTGDLVAASYQRQQVATVASSIQEEVNRVAAAQQDADGFPKRIERVKNESPKAAGDLGVMERFIKEHIDRLVAQQNDYLLELEAIGWNSVLDVSRIRNDPRMADSKLILERAKAIVAKYEKKSLDQLDGMATRINALNISDSNKRDMLAGLEKNMGKSKKRFQDQWTLEKEVVAQFESAVLMLAARNKWVLDGEQILFYNDSDAERFNLYIANIERLGQQQEKIQHDALVEANKKLDAMKAASRS